MSLTPEILVPRLGEALISENLLRPEQLELALERQKLERAAGNSIPVGQLLVDMGFISRDDLDQAITRQILKLQGALQDANKNLELRVQQRTAELEIAYKKLSELNELKSNFIANVSHELRTPLTHIQGYIDLFLTGNDYALPDEVKQGMQVMQHSTDRLNRLINDLIMFSSAEVGSLRINKSILNIKRLAERSIQIYESSAKIKDISLDLVYPEYDIEISADEDRIVWVINQLLDNAIKYTKDGGHVILAIERDSDEAVISVEDNGVGFDPSQINEIYEPFHQLDGSSKRKYGGTGIGLALVSRILEAHDSSISASSQPGKGSRFEFHLPIVSKLD